MPESVVLLHGFSATRRSWDRVIAHLDRERYRPLPLDLPGHGEAAAVRPITFDDCVAHVLAGAPDRFGLCGYSLGGRVALHVALSAPERVQRLLLISTSAGIDDHAERAARRASDHRLAAELEGEPLEEFVTRWRAQALFAGESEDVARLAREDQLRNRAGDLAEVLRGIGTGEMPPLWGRLGELSMPVTVLVGSRDEKFTALGRRMVERLPDSRLQVAPGGHNLHLESPAAVAEAVDANGQPADPS